MEKQMKLSGFSGMSGSSSNIEIRNCLFDRAFDAMVGFAGDRDIHIHHNTMSTYDDAFQCQESSRNVEFAYNRIDGPGFSHYGPYDNSHPGSVYIHHNIIDARRPILWERRNSQGTNSVWSPHRILPTHGETQNGNPWKVYNNTLLGASSSSTGVEGSRWGVNSTGATHEVYNNIVVTEGTGWITRGMSIHEGDIWDGNVYNRRHASPRAFFFEVRDGTSKRSFQTLDEFKKSSWYAATKNSYAPGWEANGMEADPKLNDAYIPQEESIWTGGVEIPNTFLPGVDGRYRGAIQPGTDGSQIGRQVTAGQPTNAVLPQTPSKLLYKPGITITNTARKVHLSSDRFRSAVIVLYDMKGSTLDHRRVCEARSVLIDTEPFACGMYIVSISMPEGNFTGRLVLRK